MNKLKCEHCNEIRYSIGVHKICPVCGYVMHKVIEPEYKYRKPIKEEDE